VATEYIVRDKAAETRVLGLTCAEETGLCGPDHMRALRFGCDNDRALIRGCRRHFKHDDVAIKVRGG
jgi:hypothetical protein